MDKKTKWMRLVESWDQQADEPLYENWPIPFAANSYERAVYRAIREAINVVENPSMPVDGLCESVAEGCGPSVVAELRKSSKADYRKTVREMETVGKHAARVRYGNPDPIRSATLLFIETLCALTIDSLLYEDGTPNALSHRVVEQRLREVGDEQRKIYDL